MNAWCLLQNYPDCFCSQKLGCASWWCVACPSKLWRTIYLRGFQLFLLLVRLDVQLDQIPDRFLASPVSGQACISQSLHRWKWFFFFFLLALTWIWLSTKSFSAFSKLWSWPSYLRWGVHFHHMSLAWQRQFSWSKLTEFKTK